MRRFGVALLLTATAAWAAPYTPRDDSTVVERLPTRRGDPVMAELRQLRAALAASPSDSGSAARAALLRSRDGRRRSALRRLRRSGVAALARERCARRGPLHARPAPAISPRLRERHEGLRARAAARPGSR